MNKSIDLRKIGDKIGKLKCYNKSCPKFNSCYMADKKFNPEENDKLILWGDVWNIIENKNINFK